jgi:hypothetical protein
MRIKRRIATAVASVAVAAGGLLAGGASPAAAASCTSWDDVNTVGVNCSGFSGQVRVVATCKDNVVKRGLWVSPGSWSYAYCSGHGGWKSYLRQFS